MHSVLSSQSQKKSIHKYLITIAKLRYNLNRCRVYSSNIFSCSLKIVPFCSAGFSLVDRPRRGNPVSGVAISPSNCATATRAAQISATFAGIRIGSNCSGDYSQGSFLIDYTVNRRFDIYAEVTFDEQTGGLNRGSLADNSWAIASGARIKPRCRFLLRAQMSSHAQS